MPEDKSVELVDMKALLSTALENIQMEFEKMPEDFKAQNAAFIAERNDEITAFAAKFDLDFAVLKKKLEQEFAALKKLSAEIIALEGDQDISALIAEREQLEEEFAAKRNEEMSALETRNISDAKDMALRWVETVPLRDRQKTILKKKIGTLIKIALLVGLPWRGIPKDAKLPAAFEAAIKDEDEELLKEVVAIGLQAAALNAKREAQGAHPPATNDSH